MGENKAYINLLQSIDWTDYTKAQAGYVDLCIVLRIELEKIKDSFLMEGESKEEKFINTLEQVMSLLSLLDEEKLDKVLANDI